MIPKFGSMKFVPLKEEELHVVNFNKGKVLKDECIDKKDVKELLKDALKDDSEENKNIKDKGEESEE